MRRHALARQATTSVPTPRRAPCPGAGSGALRPLRPLRASLARRPMVAGVGVGMLLCALVPALAGDDEGSARLSTLFRPVARLDAPVEEISGWSPLAGKSHASSRRFLAVSDEGRLDATDRTVGGALFLLTFSVGDADAISLSSSRAVTLRLGTKIPRLDPAWAGGHSLLDLEACVPLPGARDLYLLSGERNPEDITDGGANRLYVVRYPGYVDGEATSLDHADLLAYLRLPDLPDDGINDRFEAVVATRHVASIADRTDTWSVFAFKERTAADDQPPVYFPLTLQRRRGDDGDDEFGLAWTGIGQRPRALPALLSDRMRLGAQADACMSPEGRLWVLDRWRREIHVAEVPAPPASELRHLRTLAAIDVLRDVPREMSDREPAAPGCPHRGFGRHEAMTFDAHGWLWLAADLGEGRPSAITILAPRAETANDEVRTPAGGD